MAAKTEAAKKRSPKKKASATDTAAIVVAPPSGIPMVVTSSSEVVPSGESRPMTTAATPEQVPLPWEEHPAGAVPFEEDAQPEAKRDERAPAAFDPNHRSADNIATEEPDEKEVEEALAKTPDNNLASIVRRALRFVSPTQPLVRLTPKAVTGHGPRGLVTIPWQANVIDQGTIVDGIRLAQCLKACGPNPDVSTRPDGTVDVKGAGHKFKLLPHAHPFTDPPFPDSSAYRLFDPATFRQAAHFAGGENITPPIFSGVRVSEYVGATNRHMFFISTTSHAPEGLPHTTLPADAFDDIDEPCYVAIGQDGRTFIAVPSTGEFRMVRAWTDNYPDLRAPLGWLAPTFWIDVEIAPLLDAVKKSAIVQRRTSPLRFVITAQTLEVRADGVDESAVQLSSTIPIQQFYGTPPEAIHAAGFIAKFSAAYVEQLLRSVQTPRAPLAFCQHSTVGYFALGYDGPTFNVRVIPME